MSKEDLALNNLQWLICHKSQPNLSFKMSLLSYYSQSCFYYYFLWSFYYYYCFFFPVQVRTKPKLSHAWFNSDIVRWVIVLDLEARVPTIHLPTHPHIGTSRRGTAVAQGKVHHSTMLTETISPICLHTTLDHLVGLLGNYPLNVHTHPINRPLRKEVHLHLLTRQVQVKQKKKGVSLLFFYFSSVEKSGLLVFYIYIYIYSCQNQSALI